MNATPTVPVRPGGRSDRSGQWTAAAVLLAVLTVVALGALFVGGTSPLRRPVTTLGFFAMFATPAALVVLSVFGRPALLVSGAVTSGILSIFLGTVMPLLALPAIVYLLAYIRQAPGPLTGAQPAAIVVPLVCCALSALAQVRFTETRIVPHATGATGGDVTTVPASVSALILTALAITAGWFLSKPSATPGAESPNSAG